MPHPHRLGVSRCVCWIFLDIGGSVVLGPLSLLPSITMDELKIRLPQEQAELHCHVQFLAGSETPSESMTVRELAGSDETLHLTAILESMDIIFSKFL